MKNLEIRTIEHKGVKVTIRIDYDKGTASLMERSLRGDWVAKNWLFQDRGLEYMNGWQDILEAMKIAVAECKKELEKDLAEKTKFSRKLTNKVLEAMSTEELKKYRSKNRIKAAVEQVKRNGVVSITTGSAR